jgi:DNA mismatch repair protein MutH
MDYDELELGRDADKRQIIEASNFLAGKTLKQLDDSIEEARGGNRVTSKDKVNSFIEQKFFQIEDPNNSSNSDFEEEGIELKVTPLTPTGKGKLLRPKERMVIGMVDYNDILNAEHWTEVEELSEKMQDVLIVWYVHLDGDRPEYPVVWYELWNPSEEQSDKIQEDFELIQEAVKDGERLRTRMGQFFGTCPKHNSDFVKENPAESEPGALVGDHPTREYEQRRGWQIKPAGMLQILSQATGLPVTYEGRASGIDRNRLWDKIVEEYESEPEHLNQEWGWRQESSQTRL